MHPNLTLRNLVECLRPDKDETQEIRRRLDSLQRGFCKAFPHTGFVPIGSHRRGTCDPQKFDQAQAGAKEYS